MAGDGVDKTTEALHRPLLPGPTHWNNAEDEDMDLMEQQNLCPKVPSTGAKTPSMPGQGMTNVYSAVLQVWGELTKFLCCPCLCCGCGPIAVIEQGFVGVMTRFGIFERVLDPGMYVYNWFSQSIHKVCMKMQTMEIPCQDAMTRDNLKVKVDAVAFMTVVDPARATFDVKDYHHAVKTLAASTLLRVIGEHTLQEIFRDRSKINRRLTQTMRGKTAGWGVQVAGVEMRDITIPDAMQRAMAQIAEANREAEAKVIVAEGQRKAAFIFADAAETMQKSPMSLQLQWFETLRQITAEKNSTVIVPDSLVSSIAGIAQIARSNGSSGDRIEKGAPEGEANAGVRAPSGEVWTQLGPQAPA